MLIVNEMFTISNLSEIQSKHYKEEINKAQMTAESIPSITNNEEQMKSLMIEQFSRLTKLNQRWSQDVLVTSNWEIKVAEENFKAYKNEIPPDAYL